MVNKENSLIVFQDRKIRRLWYNGEWFYSVIDIVAVLTEQEDFQTARKYWNKLSQRLKEEGSEVVTNCHRLKLKAPDGKLRETTVPILKAFSDLSSSCNYCGSVFQ